MLQTSCHCGAIRIEVRRKPVRLVQCNCSICRRYAALWLYGTKRTIRIHGGPLKAVPYSWGDKLIAFYHCGKCGCVTHYKSRDKSGRIAVNARMAAPADLAGIKIRTFDGADTWKFID